MTPVMATLALALSGAAYAAPPDADTTLGLQPTRDALTLDGRAARGGRGGNGGSAPAAGSRGAPAHQGGPAAGPHGAPPQATPSAGARGGPPQGAPSGGPHGAQGAPSAGARGGPPQGAPSASGSPYGAPAQGPATAAPRGAPPNAGSAAGPHGAPPSSARPAPPASQAGPAPTARSNGQGHASHGNGVGQGHVSHGNGNGYGHTGGPPSHASGPPSHASGPPSHASGPPSHAGPPSHGAPSRPAAAPVQPRHVQAQAHPGYGSRPSAPVAPARHAAPRHAPPRHAPAHAAPRHVPAHAAPHASPRHVRPHHAPPRVHQAPHHPRYAHHGHHGSTVVIRTHYPHVRPYHGVFVYGPAPVYHQQYVASSGPVTVQEAHLPERKIDRENSLAVGIRGGSFMGGYDTAAGFSDPGLGLNVRYRPDETVGLEVALSHYGMESDDSMRTNTVGQASVELFAWPWTRVSPYVLAGLTGAGRDFEDDYLDTRTDTVQHLSHSDVQWGPHAGLGIEFALGKSVALDLEARYIGFLTAGGDDPTLPGAVQTTAGVMVHF